VIRPPYKIDLVAHLAECDANYVRIMMLMPELDRIDEHEFSVGGSCVRVRLSVLERCPYTTTVRLVQPSHELSTSELGMAPPSITVRLYHDARTAEVTEYQNHRGWQAVYPYPNRYMHLPNEKAQVNAFLSEYLSHCLRHGVTTEMPVVLVND
jgi:uncharacterized protein YqiB (DUF1249 family)